MSKSPYYPVTYLKKLKWDKEAILDFVKSIPLDSFKGPSKLEYSGTRDDKHPYYSYLYTCNDNTKSSWGDYNLTSCEAIKNVLDQFDSRWWYHLLVKKANKGLRIPFKPMLQSKELDVQEDFDQQRTWDIIFPLQGGFIESPLEILDTRSGTHYTLEPKGIPFLVPTQSYWNFSWEETVYDSRYTLHIRGCEPIKYDFIADKFS